MSSSGNGHGPQPSAQQPWSNDPRIRKDPRFASAPPPDRPPPPSVPLPLLQPPPPFPPSNTTSSVPLPTLTPPPTGLPPPLTTSAISSNHISLATSSSVVPSSNPVETLSDPTTTATTLSPTLTGGESSLSLRDDGDFVEIEEVEWAQNSEGENLSGELAVRPRYEKVDPCGCTWNGEGACCCVDETCVLYACQEECSINNCHSNCGNHRIQLKQWKPLEVFDAGIKGRGLRTLEPIKKRDFITEYVGRAIRKQYLDQLFRRYQNEQMLYIMALDNKTYLDARKKGSNARYINHSCEPNCIVERWRVRGILRAGVFALRDIEVGEELCFDYKWDRKRGRAPTKCHCKSPSCRGTLEMPRSLEEEELDRQLVGHWKAPVSKTPGSSIVNRSIRILSQEYHEYFTADVCKYDKSTGKHLVIYTHDREESWEDLTKEDWMILDQEAEAFVIARKKAAPASLSLPPSILGALQLDDESREQLKSLKNYMYVQTPDKDRLVGERLIARCEMTCRVKINVSPCLASEATSHSDEELARALEAATDGPVWKLVISSGPNFMKAFTFLEKNVAKFEALRAAANGFTEDSTQATGTTGETREVCIPKCIIDHVRRKLPLIRDKCKCVQVNFGEKTEGKAHRLVLEATLVSDLQTASDTLWKQLLMICVEVGAPKSHVSGIFADLGFLGGELELEKLKLLCNGAEDSSESMKLDQEESPMEEEPSLASSSFFPAFEATQRCTVWLETSGSSSPPGAAVDVAQPRKVYFGCDPKDVDKLWGLLQARVSDLDRRVKYLHLGADQMFQPLMMKEGNQFLEYVQKVTGASVMVDTMTGNHLRIDGGTVSTGIDGMALENALSNKSRAAGLAEEVIRLQIELYRDHFLRQKSWVFGRDWKMVENKKAGISGPNGVTSTSAAKSSRPSSPPNRTQFDERAVSNACVEIAETTSYLEVDGSAAAHAAIILHRFLNKMSGADNPGTQHKIRDILSACVFMALKAQKATKWKRLEVVLEAAYQTFYPGAKFDKTSQEALNCEKRVISAETEILITLDYDIFWRGSDWILAAATDAGQLSESRAKKVLEFAFSGPVLGAGTTLWLKYGAEYVFATAAGFLSIPLDPILSALSLEPLKVSQTATLLAEYFKSTSFTKRNASEFVEGGTTTLLTMVPKIRETCMQKMSKDMALSSTLGNTGLSDVTKRFHIIGQREQGRNVFKGVDPALVRDQILPIIDAVSIESQCSIYINRNTLGSAVDIVLEGNWRARAMAEHILLSSASAGKGNSALGETNDSNLVGVAGFPKETEPLHVDSLSKEKDDVQSIKFNREPGILQMSAVSTADGWDKTVQSDLPTLVASACRKAGGKSCIAAKIPEDAIQVAGLRWWIPPRYGPGLTGSICDMVWNTPMPNSSDTGTPLDQLQILADAFLGKETSSTLFPILHSSHDVEPSDFSNRESDRCLAVSLQRWPPEKVASREQPRSSKKGRPSMQIGFSPAALQELQLLTQLHTLIPSPRGHPNFMLPVAVAAPSMSGERDGSSGKVEFGVHDDIFSLFRTREENEKVAKNEKRQKDGPHLVCPPTPFILHRFTSRSKKKRDSDDFTISPVLLASWFHDLLSALVHCHTNNIIFKFFQSDQIVVDHSGVIKLASLYKATVQSLEERGKKVNPLKSARSARKDKGDENEDSSAANLYVAPEMLLGSKKHTKETDVWAVGCLMAHLLVKKPIFNGKDRNTLLLSMFKIVGSPSSDNCPEASKFPNYVSPPRKYKRGVKKALQYMMKEGEAEEYTGMMDLLSQMLHLDAQKRITAVQALSHDCMTNYVENSGSRSFQQQYAKDWMALKARLLQSSRDKEDEARKEKESQKRKNIFLVAASAMDNDDDLYDMDDLLGGTDPAAKKPRREEVA